MQTLASCGGGRIPEWDFELLPSRSYHHESIEYHLIKLIGGS